MAQRCICCLEDKDEALFDTEHVIPQTLYARTDSIAMHGRVADV